MGPLVRFAKSPASFQIRAELLAVGRDAPGHSRFGVPFTKRLPVCLLCYACGRLRGWWLTGAASCVWPLTCGLTRISIVRPMSLEAGSRPADARRQAPRAVGCAGYVPKFSLIAVLVSSARGAVTGVIRPRSAETGDVNERDIPA